MTSLLKPGPPPVVAQMMSKDRSPPISASRMTVAVAGRSSGSVMPRKICHALAPSTLAAS